MNPAEMVVLIVAIVMITTLMKARYVHLGNSRRGTEEPDTLRMREELKALRDRVAVLERIATDKEITLEREIERLRDR